MKYLSIFKQLCDKNCPIKEYKRKLKYSNCPWITKELQNAWKKKNTFYSEFIKLRNRG